MKEYEITFITKEPFDVAPSIKLGTSQGKDQKNPVKAEIEALGGKILNVSSIGQKNFTYTIKKEKSGFYTTIVFEIDPQKLLDLNKKLSLKEDILRHLIILYKAAKIEAPRLPKLPASPAGGPKPEKTLPKEEAKLPEPPKEIEAPSAAKAMEDKPKATPVIKPEEKKPVKKAVQKKKEADLSAVAESLKAAKAEEIEKETSSEEERMKELDKKLDELLKE